MSGWAEFKSKGITLNRCSTSGTVEIIIGEGKESYSIVVYEEELYRLGDLINKSKLVSNLPLSEGDILDLGWGKCGQDEWYIGKWTLDKIDKDYYSLHANTDSMVFHIKNKLELKKLMDQLEIDNVIKASVNDEPDKANGTKVTNIIQEPIPKLTKEKLEEYIADILNTRMENLKN